MNPIRQAIEELKHGKMIILMDDMNRENEGDLVLPAQFATGENINFMMKEGRGLICVPLKEEKAKELELQPMVNSNSDPKGTAFTVSVDHVSSTTGISAYERATTIREMSKSDAKGKDFTRPGHVFPLIAKENGVLERGGHTEASVDLMELAELEPIAVICEIAKENGEMARLEDLQHFSKTHSINIYTIEDLISYKKERDLIQPCGEAKLPTDHGDFIMKGYTNRLNGKEHFALVKGEVKGKEEVLVRIHSECMTGDVLGSQRCDCGHQLRFAMEKVEEEDQGVIVYLRQEGRGIGLVNKIKAYHLQDQGRDTIEANIELGFKDDEREYVEAVAILKDLGVKSVRLMTNNPLKIEGIEKWGLPVSAREEIIVGHCDTNHHYLQTKKEKMGHLL